MNWSSVKSFRFVFTSSDHIILYKSFVVEQTPSKNKPALKREVSGGQRETKHPLFRKRVRSVHSSSYIYGRFASLHYTIVRPKQRNHKFIFVIHRSYRYLKPQIANYINTHIIFNLLHIRLKN